MSWWRALTPLGRFVFIAFELILVAVAIALLVIAAR